MLHDVAIVAAVEAAGDVEVVVVGAGSVSNVEPVVGVGSVLNAASALPVDAADYYPVAYVLALADADADDADDVAVAV